jgi:hypothetical protein
MCDRIIVFIFQGMKNLLLLQIGPADILALRLLQAWAAIFFAPFFPQRWKNVRAGPEPHSENIISGK